MGTYTPIDNLYKPEVGEIGWGLAVDTNFDILDGGGVGGGGLNLIDVTAAPFSADPTGLVAADTAIQNAYDAAFLAAPGSGVYLPGIFNVSSNLAHFETGGITTYMPRGAKLLLSDDLGGKALFSCLGRHGYPDSTVVDGLDFIGVTVDGNSRAFSGDAWADWWQGQDQSWTRCKVIDLKGSAFNFTGCRRPSLKTVRVLNSGAGENGAAAIDWHHSDEGGDIGRLTEYGTMEDVWVIGADQDFAVYWALTYACTMTGCKIDGSGLYRSGFFGVDMAFCSLVGNSVLNGREDCIHLQSRGVATSGIDGEFSHDNIVVANVALGENSGVGGGGFFGINEYAPTGASHAGNVIANNIGTVGP